MDLFGKKRIAELIAEIAHLQERDAHFAKRDSVQGHQIEYLVRTIRKMDDIIFSMSQCSDWPSMQPRFAQLQDEMTARKVAESNRIGDIMRQELVQTYKPDLKLIGDK